jgi:hypothetical protein
MNTEKKRMKLAGKNFSRNEFLRRNVNRKLVFHSWVAFLDLRHETQRTKDRASHRLTEQFQKHMKNVIKKRVHG